MPFALAHGGFVGLEPEPCQILKNRRFVFRTTPFAVVVFDPQQHTPATRLCVAPHAERIGDVAQVQVAGRRRRKSRGHPCRLAEMPLMPSALSRC
jgi:hypothetical protein